MDDDHVRQIETFSAVLALCAENSPVTGEFSSQRPVTRALMFSLTCARTNGWINNRDAGDLRRHRAHYDATVMVRPKPSRVVRWAAAVQQSSYERSAILGPLRYWWKINAVIAISSCQCHRRCFCDPGASNKQEFILTRGTWLSIA